MAEKGKPEVSVPSNWISIREAAYLLSKIDFGSEGLPVTVRKHTTLSIEPLNRKGELFDALVTILPHDSDASDLNTLQLTLHLAHKRKPLMEATLNDEGQTWFKGLDARRRYKLKIKPPIIEGKV